LTTFNNHKTCNMRTSLLIILLLLPFYGQAQNHVPNPGFEDKSNCPWMSDQLTDFCDYWHTYNKATPDYYDTCGAPFSTAPKNSSGFQYAIGGAYAGFGAYATGVTDREYVASAIAPLEVNAFY